MDENVVEEAVADDGKRFRALLEVDVDCENPRDNASLMGMIVHVRDRHHIVPQEGELAQTIAEACDEHDFPVVARWLKIFHGAAVVLPLAYRALSAGDRNDTNTIGNYWGVIWTKEEAGLFDADTLADQLIGECDEYGQWAEGECFGVVIEISDDDESWEHRDSVWGLIGDDYAREQARTMLGEAVSLYEYRGV